MSRHCTIILIGQKCRNWVIGLIGHGLVCPDTATILSQLNCWNWVLKQIRLGPVCPDTAILFSSPHSPVGVWQTGPDSTGLHQTDQTHLNLCLNCNESGGLHWTLPDWTRLLLKFLDGNRVLGLTRLQSGLPSPVDWTGLHWTDYEKIKKLPRPIKWQNKSIET